jgi:hypothetical protein
VFDGLGPEGGEKRLINSAEAPGGENGDQQFRRPRQKRSDTITFRDTEFGQPLRELRRARFTSAKGPVADLASRVPMPERNPERVERVTITASLRCIDMAFIVH